MAAHINSVRRPLVVGKHGVQVDADHALIARDDELQEGVFLLDPALDPQFSVLVGHAFDSSTLNSE